MHPGSVTTSIIRLGDQKLTLTPNQKVAPLLLAVVAVVQDLQEHKEQ